ncbi:MAG: tetratricopeptide repeat-containing sensor histidine kinase [Patiriisocius sp.]|uniref:tetratricopeptide repeat-containing sensor histidine kinase n=1 Tax=Patiriisocius sp. TaxID=2822396 RepID=UPI003EF11B14
MKKHIYILFLFCLIKVNAQDQKLNELSQLVGYPIETERQFQNLNKLHTYIISNFEEKRIQDKFSFLLNYEQSALEWAEENGTRDQVLEIKFRLLEIEDILKHDFSVIKLGERLLLERENLPLENVAKIIDHLIEVYNKIEAYDDALRIEKLKKEFFKNHPGYVEKGYTDFQTLGMAYYKLGNFERAIENFEKQAFVYDTLGNQLMKSSMFHNVGLSYFKLKKFDSASVYYNIALDEISKPSKVDLLFPKEDGYNYYFEKVIKGSIGDLKFEEGNYNEALQLYKDEILAATTGEKPIGESRIVTSCYYKLAKTYYMLGEQKEAKSFIEKAILSIDDYDDVDQIVDIYTLQGKLFLLENSLNLANLAFERSKSIKDSVQVQRLKRQNLLALTKFDVEAKEDEISKYQQEVLINEKINTLQKIALFATLVLFSIIVFLYFKSRKSNKVIKGQKIILEASVREKEILLKEVHHRVKNNLQVITGLLQLQSKKATSETMSKALEDSQRHIDSMALVHEMLYQQEDQSMVPMCGYLKKLTNQLLYSFNYSSISAKVDVNNETELSINKAIPLGLVLSELLINTNKHAFDGKDGLVTVSLWQLEKSSPYVFEFTDNGKGLPNDYEKNLKKTLGFRLLYMLTEEMDGTITVDGKNGVRVTIHFKDDYSNE